MQPEETETPEPEVRFSGSFDQKRIELTVGDVTTVSGRVHVEGDTLNRVTYQIDGWDGDDGNNRYCSQELRGQVGVELSQMNQLVLDTNREPLNVPGEYTLRLVASVESGEWEKLASMTVVVKAADEPTHSATAEPTETPIIEWTVTPEPQTVLSGAFASDYIELNIGDVTTVGGSVSCTGSTLNRVTYQIEGWAGDALYFKEVTLPLTVKDNGTTVRAVLTDGETEREIFRTVLNAGEQTVTLTVDSGSAGE